MGILKLNVKVCSIGQSGFDGGALAHVKATWWPVQFTHFVSLTLACTCGKPTSKRIASHRGFFFSPHTPCGRGVWFKVLLENCGLVWWRPATTSISYLLGESPMQLFLSCHIDLTTCFSPCWLRRRRSWKSATSFINFKRIKLAFHGLVSWLFNKKTYASIHRNLTWKILVSPLAPNCQNLQTNNLRFQNDTNPSGARNSFSLARHSHELHGVEFLALHFAKFRKSARGFWSQVTALPQDLWAWWQRVAAILAGLIRLRSCQVDM